MQTILKYLSLLLRILRSFLWHRGGNRGTGGRAYNTLMAHAKLDDEGPLGELASYFVHDQNGVPVGVRPERLRDIVDDIRSGAIYVKNFGKPSENLLLSLYFELFPEQVEDQ